MIKLTYLDDAAVYINPYYIVAIDQDEKGITRVLVSGIPEFVRVKEPLTDLESILIDR